MAQRSKTDPLSRRGATRLQWVTRPQLAVIAEYAQKHLQLSTKFALCHGARSGREAVWFRELLPNEQVWGTELSPVAARSAPWTMQGDFHDERPEWVGAADFVYCNALDHSYNASLAITRWMQQVHTKGATIIQWSNFHERKDHGPAAVDIFSATRREMVQLICSLPSRYSLFILTLPKGATFSGRSNEHAYVVTHTGSNRTRGECGQRT